MNRNEFLSQLERCLSGVSIDERVAAMQYYNEYFDDAGVENEAQVIEELGSPEKIAEDIKASSAEEGWVPPEKTEPVFQQPPNNTPPPYTQQSTPPLYSSGQPQQQAYASSNDRTLKVVLAVIAGIFLLPVVGGIGGSLIGVIVSLAVSIVILCSIPFIIGSALIASGVGVFIASFTLLPYTIGNAFIMMGVGLFLFAGGILSCFLGAIILKKVTVPLCKACVTGIQALVQHIVSFFKKIFA